MVDQNVQSVRNLLENYYECALTIYLKFDQRNGDYFYSDLSYSPRGKEFVRLINFEEGGIEKEIWDLFGYLEKKDNLDPEFWQRKSSLEKNLDHVIKKIEEFQKEVDEVIDEAAENKKKEEKSTEIGKSTLNQGGDVESGFFKSLLSLLSRAFQGLRNALRLMPTPSSAPVPPAASSSEPVASTPSPSLVNADNNAGFFSKSSIEAFKKLNDKS